MLQESPSAEQADRVRALWHRQLAVPLAENSEALEAYKAWEQAQAGGEEVRSAGCRGGACTCCSQHPFFCCFAHG